MQHPDTNNTRTGMEIAVIGYAGRFPGAVNINEFWNNLRDGVESIAFFSDRELVETGIPLEQIKNPHYIKARGVLADIERFDAAFFEYTAREAEIMDPQLRILMEISLEALENAGYDPWSYQELIGFYAGASPNYLRLFGDRFKAKVNPQQMTEDQLFEIVNLNFGSSYCTHISYKLDLKGPSVFVQTACSTSLAAVHLACQGLLLGECDIALAGAVSISVPQKSGYLYQEGMLFSSSGHVKSFDEKADGTVFGNGAAIVVLKPLENAIADRDTIHTVVKGSAINNDGCRKVGFTAPGTKGQAAVIHAALRAAEVEPESISYIETHGTGTLLGDLIEIDAIKMVFGADSKMSCAVGSVKTNIGHLDATSGIAGFIKTVLALEYKQIPASLNFEVANPKNDLNNSRFYVNTTLKEWRNPDYPLRAGVSSFGIGGTNAHVVLEEYPVIDHSPYHISVNRKEREYQLILLSAQTAPALERMTRNLAKHFRENQKINLADAVYTLQVGRKAFKHRRIKLCSNLTEAVEALSSTTPGKLQTFTGRIDSRPVIFMFPGQGAQYVNMGLDLYKTEKIFREEMDLCFDILKPIMGYDIKEILYPGDLASDESELGEDSSPVSSDFYISDNSNDINQTEIAQPLLFVFEYALAKLLMDWGIRSDEMMGHSIGEYVAAHLSGVFSLEDALKIVVLRGQIMQQMPAGSMLVIPLPAEELQPLLNMDSQLSLAAVNTPDSCVVSGPHEAVEQLAGNLKEKGLECKRLHTSHAFHSHMMEPIVPAFEKEISRIKLNKPQIPFISNVTGKWITDRDAVNPSYWARHLREMVRFSHGLTECFNNPGSVFIEVGPGRVLTSYLKQHSSKKPEHLAVNLIRHPKTIVPDNQYLLSQLGMLWLYGVRIDWSAFHRGEMRHRIPLPTYAFEEQRYWSNNIKVDAQGMSREIITKKIPIDKNEDIADWFYIPFWKPFIPTFTPDGGTSEPLRWWVFLETPHVGVGIQLVKELEKANQFVTAVKVGADFRKEAQKTAGHTHNYTVNPQQFADFDAFVLEQKTRGSMPNRIIHLWGITRENPAELEPNYFENARDFGFYSLLYIVQALEKHQVTGDICLTVVTDNMQDVTGQETVNPGKSTVIGLIKVIPQEYPHLNCRSIDIEVPRQGMMGREGEILRKRLLGELMGDIRHQEIAIRGNYQWTRVYEPVRLEENVEPASAIKAGGVYLVVGGFGMVGSMLAAYLAKNHKARLILTGRTALPDRDHWEEWLVNHSDADVVSQRIRKVKELEASGAEVMVFAADAADRRQMQQVIEQTIQRFGRINGVIFSAVSPGEELYKAIKNLDKQACEDQFRVKGRGLMSLEVLLKDLPLDFFLVMSSISAVLGGLGFAAYSAANILTDSLVLRHNKNSDIPWLSVNWDNWQTYDELQENKEGSFLGVSIRQLAMTPQEGIKAFQRVLSVEGVNRLVQSTGELQQRINQWTRPKLESPEEEMISFAAEQDRRKARRDLTSAYTPPTTPTEKVMKEIWQTFFGYDKVGILDDFFELGGDSLKAVHLVSLMHKKLQVQVGINEIFTRQTIKQLAEYVDNSRTRKHYSIDPVEKKEYFALSSAQKRIYFLQQMNINSTAYNIPLVLLLEKNTDKHKLETALKKLVVRHESLRTSFHMLDETPVQKIHPDVDFEIELDEMKEMKVKSEQEKKSPVARKNPEINSFIRPFDLSHAPLLRSGLFKLTDNHYTWIIDIHHIVSDGTSQTILTGDFTALYQEEELAMLRLQYKDFSQWQNNLFKSREIEKQAEYWMKVYPHPEEIPVLQLPTDYERPEVFTYAGDEYGFMLEPGDTARLKQLSHRHNGTLYMNILAVLNTLFHQYTSQTDIIIGSGIAGRPHADLQQIVGMFINTLALRNFPQGEKTYETLLQEVIIHSSKAFENQDLQFEELINQLAVKRDPSRNPLFDIFMIVQNYRKPGEYISQDLQSEQMQGEVLPMPAEDLPHISNGNGTSKFDMTFFVREMGNRIYILIEYYTGIFKPDTIKRMAGQFKNVVKTVVDNPGIKLKDIEITSAEEKKQVLYEFNDTFNAYSNDKTIHELFEEQVGKTPDKIAVIGIGTRFIKSPVKSHGGKSPLHVTYRELNQESDRLSHILRKDGIYPDSIVGLKLERSIELIIGVLAILKAGGACLPIDADYPPHLVNYMLADSGTKLLVTSRTLEKMSKKEGKTVNRFSSPGKSSHLIYVIYTSGTTGKSKGVMLEHRNLVNLLIWGFHYTNLDFNSVLQFTSISFDVSFQEIFSTLLSGGKLCLIQKEERTDIPRLFDVIRRNDIKTLFLPVSLLKVIFNHKRYIEGFPTCVTHMITAGEQLIVNDALREYLKEKKIFLHNHYGPSESHVVTALTLEPAGEIPALPPIGKPVANTRIFILDTYRNVLPLGVPGELYIGGVQVGRGYLNKPGLTRERFINAGSTNFPGNVFKSSAPVIRGAFIKNILYRTGDLARWLPDGNIEFLGRKDLQVKIRGFRIELEGIRNQLLAHPGVKEAVVTVQGKEPGDKYLCAYFAAGPEYLLDKKKVPSGIKPITAELKEFLSRSLPDYMIPSYFVQLDRIPLTINGKVNREALPIPGLIPASEYAAPRDQIEKKLAAIWIEVLDREVFSLEKHPALGIDDNFFELGGHSLKAAVLAEKIHKVLNVKVPLAEIFQCQTIRGLSGYIRKLAVTTYTDIEPIEKKEYYALSSAQKRLYFLQQMDMDSTAYNMPMILQLEKNTDKNKLEAAMKKLVTRHESLRTSFIMKADEPVQRVHEPDEVEFEMEYLNFNKAGSEKEAGEKQAGAEAVKDFIRPFDLSRAPLVRSAVFIHPPDHHYWMVDIHHIISDGTSQTILSEDFVSLYHGDELSPLGIQYKDFARWQNDLFKGGEIKIQEDYWMNLFSDAGNIPRLRLPIDYKRPEVFTFAGNQHTFILEPEETAKFKDLSLRTNGTLYMNLLAALNTLFYKYTSQTDIIIGSGIAGRRHADLQSTVGMFVNTVAMRNYPQGEKTFLSFLKELIQNSIKGFENQDVQFEELVDKLEVERDASRNPLFDISMVVQNFRQSGQEREERTAEDTTVRFEVLPDRETGLSPVGFKNLTAKFDMTFFVHESVDSISITIEYYSGIFKPDTIKRLVSHFKNVIKTVVKEPGIKLDHIEIISLEEKENILYGINDTAREYPGFKTVHKWFAVQAARTPDHTALVFNEKILTYGELELQSNRLAHYFYYKKGLEPNHEAPVGIWMPESLNQVICILGILKSGCAYVPIDPSLPPERIKFIINDASIGIIISEKKYVKPLNQLQWECQGFHTYLCMDSDNIHSEEEAEENELMSKELWHHVGETAGNDNDIAGGGWVSSYTGEPMSRGEMDEYSDNIFKKLQPLLHPGLRVLEIGCASGISMYRLAPEVGFYYGTDLSGVIIQWNRKRAAEQGYENMKFTCAAAHQIANIDEKDFDLIIINSVIHCFPGHNYLGKVLRTAVQLLGEKGYVFIGDVMDQDKKDALISDLIAFKNAHRDKRDKNYRTKTDFSSELFVSRGYWEDLAAELNEIEEIEFSNKIYSLENELTRFRYDTLIKINKQVLTDNNTGINRKKRKKIKNQDDARILSRVSVEGLDLDISPGSLAYIIYTSGTTGSPKGVMINHKALLNYIYRAASMYVKEEALDFPLYTPISFDLTMTSIFVPLVTGNTVVVYGEEEKALNIETIIGQDKVGVVKLTPSHLKLIKQISSNGKTSHIKRFIVGGEELETALAKDISKHFNENIEIFNEYGPTEATVGCMIYKYNPGDDTGRSVPIGKPLSNTEIYILDERLHPVPYNVAGELYISGDGVARGYLGSPELTSEKFLVNPFIKGRQMYRTGDLARWLPEGNAEFLGRIDSQVKIRGFRIELGEIENLLLKHDIIREAVVIDRTDEKGDKYLCAYIVGDNGAKDAKGLNIGGGELREYLSPLLPDYMIPSNFHWLETIPLTANGKLDRKALPAPEFVPVGDVVAPRDEVEMTMAEIWSEILDIEKEKISIEANFFELGGHSLKATILTSKIHKELKVKVPLAQVFKSQTLKRLSAYVAQLRYRGESKYDGIKPVEEREYYRLSSAQKRLYFLQQMDLNSTSYNKPMVVPLGKDIEIKKLELALMKLIARHESLRTSFVQVKELPVQKIYRKESINFSMDYFEADVTGAGEIVKNYIKPFDLGRAPLLKSGIIKLPDEHVTWILDMHHIISDGTSHTVLTEDFLALYSGEELELLRLQYKAFSQWQNQLFTGEEIKSQEDYWLSLYTDAGEIPRLNLPEDFPRPEIFLFAGDTYDFVLEKEEVLQFKTLGTRNGATLYMNMLAVLNTLFYKYTGQTDIIIGSGIAGRVHADLQQIVGMFVNTLAMRNHPDGEKTYEAFLKEVAANSIKAFENQDLQFEEFVDKLDIDRVTSRNPLFDIAMVVQNFRQQDPVNKKKENKNRGNNNRTGTENIDQFEVLLTADRDLPRVDFRNLTTKFDMTFFVHESEDGDSISISIEYYTGIFKQDTIQRLGGHLKNMIQAIIRNPTIKLKNIEIISEEEKRQVLYEFNNTDQDFPKNMTIHQLFNEQVQRTPDHMVLLGEDEKWKGCGDKRIENRNDAESLVDRIQITYTELNEKSNQVANYLYLEKQVRPDEPVGIMSDRSIYLIAALLGIMKAGGAYVPIEPDLPEKRIKHIIKDTQIHVLISQKRNVRLLDRLQWICECFDTYLCIDSFDIHSEDEIDENDLMEKKLWEYIGKNATDEITGGGWVSSYTNQPFSKEEMDEYGDNALEKLTPILHKTMRVLEIGCASGITMYRIAPKVGFYHGTDLSGVIIEKNRERIKKQGYTNIEVSCTAALQIDRINRKNFDLIILNSVIQGFHSHNYLRKIIRKSIGLLGEKGFMFMGDIMDQEKKNALVEELAAYKLARQDKPQVTKTDFSSELFIARGFWKDLEAEWKEIIKVEISDKIYTIENELTKFRYDVLITIDKGQKLDKKQGRKKSKQKYQDDLRALMKFSQENLPQHVSARNLAYIIYTSGSTGKPKGVMLEHSSVANTLVWRKNQYGFDTGDVVLQLPAVAFDSSVTDIFTPIISGSRLVLIRAQHRFDINYLKHLFEAAGITHFIAVPTLYRIYLEEIPGSLRGMKHMTIAGEHFKEDLVNHHFEKLRHVSIYNEYGPSENSVNSTIYQFRPGKTRILIGSPIANVRCFILERGGTLCPIGVVGELLLSGPGIARGYLNNPGLTSERFINYKLQHTNYKQITKYKLQITNNGAGKTETVPGKIREQHNKKFLRGSGGQFFQKEPPGRRRQKRYKTGDLARWLPDGNIEFIGRIDHQVKIRGFRIELGEIEAQLVRHPEVKEAVVMVRENGEKYICAYLVLKAEHAFDNEAPPTLAETLPGQFKEYLAGTLPDYMIPSYFVILEQIPLKFNGKIDHKALPAPGIAASQNYTAPRNEIEKKMVEIWSDVLGIDGNRINTDHNFFDLGGHSLKATILASKIHREMKVIMPLAEVFKRQTIRGLSEYIKKTARGKYSGIEPVEKKEYYELSSAQKRLYVMQQMEPASLTYNGLSFSILEGRLDVNQLEQIFLKLIRRHESFRTSIHLIENEPFQQVCSMSNIAFTIKYYDIYKVKGKENVKDEAVFRGKHESRYSALKAEKIIKSFIKPFDLSHPPFLRVGLIKQEKENHILMMQMHHIVTDAISFDILVKEFLALLLYKELPVLRLQYKDYTQWQYEQASSEKMRKQEEFWLIELQGELPVLNLPYDYSRSIIKGCEGSILNFEIGKELTKGLKDLASAESTTLYLVLLSVYNVLLAKLTGQEDIIVGTPVVGRRHTDLMDIVGMFVNTVVLRNFPKREKTFREFLKEVEERTLAAFENQDYPFEELVKNIYASINRDSGRNPLVDVIFSFQNYVRLELEIPGLRLTPYEFEHITSHFDLVLFASDQGDSIALFFEFSTTLFKRSTIEKIKNCYLDILARVLQNNHIKLEEIAIKHDLITATANILDKEDCGYDFGGN